MSLEIRVPIAFQQKISESSPSTCPPPSARVRPWSAPPKRDTGTHGPVEEGRRDRQHQQGADPGRSPGNLVISEVRQSDEGRYVCVAENMAGFRESVPVHMAVYVKPFFVKEPEHLTVLANVDITFPCKVDGDPRPSVIWRKINGKLPIGRAELSDDRSLIVKNVTVADEGTYICEAENLVGSITSEVTLTVHSRPNFFNKTKRSKNWVERYC
ncbi:roundabout homolog 2 [Caerostris extrusa]|uniref:Roundabout homolog 2 n=1 Tax=Caerostris extrusa TaxID=172846 RepID=A0AAV4XAE4_CAEEX|nr:roundabout homolog 2 [Caerostris extrusa]